jgi:hypothetical protein
MKLFKLLGRGKNGRSADARLGDVSHPSRLKVASRSLVVAFAYAFFYVYIYICITWFQIVPATERLFSYKESGVRGNKSLDQNK